MMHARRAACDWYAEAAATPSPAMRAVYLGLAEAMLAVWMRERACASAARP